MQLSLAINVGFSSLTHCSLKDVDEVLLGMESCGYILVFSHSQAKMELPLPIEAGLPSQTHYPLKDVDEVRLGMPCEYPSSHSQAAMEPSLPIEAGFHTHHFDRRNQNLGHCNSRLATYLRSSMRGIIPKDSVIHR